MSGRGEGPTRRAALLGALALAGCGAAPRAPDVASLYRYAGRMNPSERRPIIAIPGLLGSRLRVGEDGPFAWGGPRRLSPDVSSSDGLRRLALPVGRGDEPLAALTDEVRPAGVLREANALLLFGSVQQQVYAGLIEVLRAGGYGFLDSPRAPGDGETAAAEAFEFAYDWRRGIVEAAQALDAFVAAKTEEVRAARLARFGEAPPPDEIRFDFVAHSLGALVLRWWLMYGAAAPPEDGSPLPPPDWTGARRTACAVFVGPPNLGSITSFRSLLEGRRPGPFTPRYPPGLLGTYPSLYQLMPRDRHGRVTVGGPDDPSPGSLYDVETWAERRWGLLDPAEDGRLAALMPDAGDRSERERRARAHIAKCLASARQVHQGLDRRGAPDFADLFLVAGTGLDTPAALVLDAEGRPARVLQEEGDGVVLRASALMDERQGSGPESGPRRPVGYRTVLLLPGEHVELTRNPVFADNLLYWLLGSPLATQSRESPGPSAERTAGPPQDGR